MLPGPEVAARAAADAPGKKRGKAEEAITAAVANALHLLGALKQCIFLLSGKRVLHQGSNHLMQEGRPGEGRSMMNNIMRKSI